MINNNCQKNITVMLQREIGAPFYFWSATGLPGQGGFYKNSE